MHSNSYRATGLLSVGLIVAALSGCAEPSKQGGLSRDVPDDDAFAAAADRPPTPATLFVMARILAAQGREPECRHVLERIIHDHPGFVPAYCALAEHHMRVGRTDDAIHALQVGLALAPKDAVLLNNLGMVLMIRAEYTKAVDQFAAATAAAPGDAGHRANLAAALGMCGRYDEALAAYGQVLSEQDAHYNLAVVCEARDDQARAQAEYAAALATTRTLAKPGRDTQHSPAQPR